MNELVLLKRIESLEKLIMRQPEIGGVWQNWTPSAVAGTMYITGLTVNYAKYCVVGNIVFISARFNGTLAGTASTNFTVEGLPVSSTIYPTPVWMYHTGLWNIKGFATGISGAISITDATLTNMGLSDVDVRLNAFGIM